MGELIRSPGNAWWPFLQGAGAVFAGAIVPMAAMVVHGAKTAQALLGNIGIAALIMAVMCALAGAVCALPALMYAWAYRQVTDDTDADLG